MPLPQPVLEWQWNVPRKEREQNGAPKASERRGDLALGSTLENLSRPRELFSQNKSWVIPEGPHTFIFSLLPYRAGLDTGPVPQAHYGMSRRDDTYVLSHHFEPIRIGRTILTQPGTATQLPLEQWLLQNNALATFNPEAFGAQGDATHDDTLGVQSAIDAAAAIGGGIVRITGRYLCNNLTLRANVSLTGIWLGGPDMNGTYPNWYLLNGQIALQPGASITVSPNSSISNMILIRAGLPLAAAEAAYQLANTSPTGPNIAAAQALALTLKNGFSGTGIFGNSTIFEIENVMLLGFNKGLDLHSPGGVNAGRFYARNVRGDNTNGISFQDSGDVCRVDDCHMWPFLTVGCPGDPGVLYRAGVGFYIGNRNDWSQLLDCFAYGYQTDFEVDAGSAISFVGCKADNIGLQAHTAGFACYNSIGAPQSAEYVSFINCQSISNDIGIVLGAPDALSPAGRVTARIIGGLYVGTVGIQVTYGYAIIIGNHFQIGTGVSFSATADGGTLALNHYDASGIYIDPAVEPNVLFLEKSGTKLTDLSVRNVLEIKTVGPALTLFNTAGAANQMKSDFYMSSDFVSIRFVNDAYTAATATVNFHRIGIAPYYTEFKSPIVAGVYTVATMPAPSVTIGGCLISIGDRGGRLAYCNSAAWLWVADDSVVS